MPQQHEVDFTIVGDDMQFVEMEPDPGESRRMYELQLRNRIRQCGRP
jgi:hypothetical protein